jgi:hypothetical protein
MGLDLLDGGPKVQAWRIASEGCNVDFTEAEALIELELAGAIVKTLIFEEDVLAVPLIL